MTCENDLFRDFFGVLVMIGAVIVMANMVGLMVSCWREVLRK